MKREEIHLDFQDIWPIALVLVVTGIGIAYGLDIMTDVQGDFVTGAADCNSTSTVSCGANYHAMSNATEGIGNFSEKLPTIALVIVAAILIGILIRNLARA